MDVLSLLTLAGVGSPLVHPSPWVEIPAQRSIYNPKTKINTRKRPTESSLESSIHGVKLLCAWRTALLYLCSVRLRVTQPVFTLHRPEFRYSRKCTGEAEHYQFDQAYLERRSLRDFLSLIKRISNRSNPDSSPPDCLGSPGARSACLPRLHPHPHPFSLSYSLHAYTTGLSPRGSMIASAGNRGGWTHWLSWRLSPAPLALSPASSVMHGHAMGLVQELLLAA